MSSRKSKTNRLPELSSGARIFYRSSSDEYTANAYQYGSTSHKWGTMRPAIVIYPDNLQDIITVVNHARKQNIGVAVRTGGHQYCGASSTSGDNIQIDMSDVFQGEEDFNFDRSKNLLHIGISFSLLEVNNRLRENKIFLPHGQCVHVHLGGHFCSGGYGQLSRAFGLLCDHCEGFDIVLANGVHTTIWRPGSVMAKNRPNSVEEKLNNDLFWAVLGGSPGCFGILTHVWLRPHHDKDHPDSRGMKLLTTYSREKMEKILNVTAEMNDDMNLPQDFDLCITTTSDAVQSWGLRSLFQWKPKYNNLDEKIMVEHPDCYADGVEWAEQGKMSIPAIPTPTILIYLQWANVKGAQEKFGNKHAVWFEKIREASSPNIMDMMLGTVKGGGLADSTFSALKKIWGHKDVRNYLYVDYRKHTPMSELTRYWVYEDVREYVKPYEKRAYASNKHNLRINGWPAWCADRLDRIVNGDDKSIDVISQIQPFGGKNSMYRRNGRPELNNGCHSWRDEFSMLLILDVFYQPEDDDDRYDKKVHRVLQYQTENDTCCQKGGIFCDEDRRFMFGSFGKQSDPDCGCCLDTVYPRYYDSEEKYQRLVAIKRAVDPKYVFTANMFGVDATNAPQNRRIKIEGRGHGMRDGGGDIKIGALPDMQPTIKSSWTWGWTLLGLGAGIVTIALVYNSVSNSRRTSSK